MNNPLSILLNHPIISRIRRNHGLEHASIHLLSQKFPGTSIAGHSDPGGFWLLGNLETDAVQSAVEQALSRMQAGESKLAVHPNCGTNLAVAGLAAGLAGAFSMFGVGSRWRDKLERIPLAVTLATLALILSQPLGLLFQERVTTSGTPGTLKLVRIVPGKKGSIRTHRVITRG